MLRTEKREVPSEEVHDHQMNHLGIGKMSWLFDIILESSIYPLVLTDLL